MLIEHRRHIAPPATSPHQPPGLSTHSTRFHQTTGVDRADLPGLPQRSAYRIGAKVRFSRDTPDTLFATSVDFRHGNASDMPFADGAFDFLICCAAFKNFADPAGALREMRRVLRDGGSGLIVDLRRDVSKGAVEQDVARMGMGAVAGAFTTFALRWFLPRRAYTKAGFEALVSKAGFGSYEVRQTPMALEVELRK
ncbi:class I SAM-dependent methyltransferase [[Actinomadura] parvosata]